MNRSHVAELRAIRRSTKARSSMSPRKQYSPARERWAPSLGPSLDFLQRQGDAAEARIDREHAHPDHLAHVDDLGRIRDEARSKFGDVDEAVLMDTEIDERPEARHVGHDAFENHV